MTDRYIISVEETAVYEIMADDKEEAITLFEAGGGDFIGWDEQRGREILVERFDDGLDTKTR